MRRKKLRRTGVALLLASYMHRCQKIKTAQNRPFLIRPYFKSLTQLIVSQVRTAHIAYHGSNWCVKPISRKPHRFTPRSSPAIVQCTSQKSFSSLTFSLKTKDAFVTRMLKSFWCFFKILLVSNILFLLRIYSAVPRRMKKIFRFEKSIIEKSLCITFLKIAVQHPFSITQYVFLRYGM